MKKGLSLKKKSEPPKDQPSITSFFKKPKDNELQNNSNIDRAPKRKTTLNKVLLAGRHSLSDEQQVPSCDNVKKVKVSKQYNNEEFKTDFPSSNSRREDQAKEFKVSPKQCNKNEKSPLKEINNLNYSPKHKSVEVPSINEKELENHLADIKGTSFSKKSEESVNNNINNVNDYSQGRDLECFNVNDNWEMEACFEVEELDLSVWQRCSVIETFPSDNGVKVKLQNQHGEIGSCQILGTWSSLNIENGTILSLIADKDENGYVISNTGGMLVLWPDHLLSSTTVVGSVFCTRRVVLQEKFRGLDPANKIMTIGSLVHALFQEALQKKLKTFQEVKQLSSELLSSYKGIYMLFEADLSTEEASSEMDKFIPQIVTFVLDYIDKDQTKNHSKVDFKSVVDIEENLYCPSLGLKGKIDVTLQVQDGSVQTFSPLELKTGRPSVSAEHRGQLILYGMMLAIIDAHKTDSKIENSLNGLLLYLRDKITLKEVKSVYPERRDLLMLRNQLAHYLRPISFKTVKPKSSRESVGIPDGLQDLEDLNLSLPEPINHHSACGKCPYLTTCSIYLWNTPQHKVSEGHPLFKLKSEASDHLSRGHYDYFMHWMRLLLIEESDKNVQNPLTDLWTKNAREREARGKCLSGMIIHNVRVNYDKNIHTFVRKNADKADSLESSCLSKGDYVVVSTDRRVNLASGHVVKMDREQIQIALERDLTKRNKHGTLFHIDNCESQSQNVFNFTNLGVLMDNTEQAAKLRKFIIDKSEPTFSPKLPRSVSEQGMKLMKKLNRLQQRAILRAIAAEDFLLIKGMPGTGKTQTVSVLIQMLVALGKSVLVTSQTHSAIDNVLVRLPQEINLVRLGPTERIHPDLLMKGEEAQTSHFDRPSQLNAWCEAATVVGVTCLGSSHTMLTKRVFDVCIVDESTQVLQPTVLRALFAAKKFILIGDPNQLPPIVRTPIARKMGMDESLFERLDSDATVSLSLQYRMNSTITELANRFVYKDQLKCADDIVANACIDITDVNKEVQPAWVSKCLSANLLDAVKVIDTGSTIDCQVSKAEDDIRQHNCQNSAEAVIVIKLVDCLIENGISQTEIGIITPYRDQVSLLTKLLKIFKGVEVNTVDQYQGRDKTVIIYSCCKTWSHQNDDFTVKDTEILEDKRRLTVAITRSKRKLILVGDVKTLSKYTTFKRLFSNLTCMDNLNKTNSYIQFDKAAFETLYNSYEIMFKN